MPAPFDVRPRGGAGPVEFSIDANGNLTVGGNVTVGGGAIILPTQAAAPQYVPGAGVLYSPDGSVLTLVSPSGASTPVGFGGSFAPVTGAGATVTGTTAKTLLFGGMTVPAGGFATGQIYRLAAWGVLTTTAGADTFKIETYLGGIAGTSIMSFGTQQPNSGALVTNAHWVYRAEFVLLDATHMTGWGDDGLNFFPNTLNNSPSTAISNTAAQQIVLATTASANGDSITCQGAYCMRVA